jgi:hypothetical protein
MESIERINQKKDNECPICFEPYGEQEDGWFRCKDSIDNSYYENITNCRHYICVPCCQTLHDVCNVPILCPICRADWTDFIADRYAEPTEDDVDQDDEDDVDDVEAPNIFPYKKCSVCKERSSCGNYTDDKEWLCESCQTSE